MLKKFFNKYIIKPKIKIKGENNDVKISSNTYYVRKVRINVYGNNNKVFIDDYTYLHDCTINVGFPDSPINNCSVFFGKKSSCNSLNIQLGESNSRVSIGDDCMISFNVEIACTDSHAIIDMDGNILNIGESIDIGSHVWICKNSTIMKNTKIPDNSIVAQGSVVTKKFEQNNVIIAGCPAKIVKENINWDGKRVEQYKN